MILDAGICSVFHETDRSLSGEMPRPGYTLLTKSWYAELSFETSPQRPTEGREELRTDARIRVLQDRRLRQGDVVILRDLDLFEDRSAEDTAYRVTRAYHGRDDEGPALITDLTLEVYEP